MTVGDDTATLSDCGCKGARYCAACMHTARVQALQHTPSSDADILRQFDTVLIWCNECAAAFPASYTVDPADIDSVARAAADCTQHRHVISSSGVHVDGLIVCLDLLSEEEEADIVRRIDRTHWMPSQSGRRKQDYGPKVNFKKRKVRCAAYEGVPDYGRLVLERMRARLPDQLHDYTPFELCNLEYASDRRACIEWHRDDQWIWGNRLISVNLIAGAVMSFRPADECAAGRFCTLLLVHMPRRSLLCMRDAARYDWLHGILAVHCNAPRRIALTMREPAAEFVVGGALYEQYGRELNERAQITLDTNQEPT